MISTTPKQNCDALPPTSSEDDTIAACQLVYNLTLDMHLLWKVRICSLEAILFLGKSPIGWLKGKHACPIYIHGLVTCLHVFLSSSVDILRLNKWHGIEY